jgi:excisionase family DNA binding protein
LVAIVVMFLVSLYGRPAHASDEVPPARRLYSINEAAALLSVTPKHVYALAYDGQLATVKLGRRRLIPAEALDSFIAGLVEPAS